MTDHSNALEELLHIVRSARPLALNKESIAQRSEKGAFDYATQADIRVQAYLKEELRKRWPGFLFMGEEGVQELPDPASPAFVVDPIDGTTNLIHLYPACAVSVAMVVEGQTAIGLVYNPFNDQMFYAQRGKGAYCDGKPLGVSGVDSLGESLISIGTSPNDKSSVQEDFAIIADLFNQVQDIRRCGAAALEIVYVASGIADAFFERNLKPWDYAAASLILEEAGGRITNFNNETINPLYPGSCLATNGGLHQSLLPYVGRLGALR